MTETVIRVILVSYRERNDNFWLISWNLTVSETVKWIYFAIYGDRNEFSGPN